MRRFFLCLALGTVSLAHRTAFAGNEDEIFVGNEAALVGGAVVATVKDGGSLWYNPAGLGAVKRDQLDATTSVYSLRLYRANDFIASDDGRRSQLAVNDFVSVPVQVSFVRPLDSRLSLGLGYFQPRGSRLTFDVRHRGASSNVAGNVAMSGVSDSSEIALGAAVGLALGPRLRLGGGLLLRWDSLLQSVDLFATTTVGDQVTELLDSSRLHEQDVLGLEPVAGVQWQPTQRLSLGINLRGPRLSPYSRDHNSSTFAVGTAQSDSTGLVVDGGTDDKSKGSVALARAGRYGAGLCYRLGATDLRAEADWQPAYDDAANGIQRHSAWNARLGASHQLSQMFTLGVGLFTDRSATANDQASLVRGDSNFYGGSAGVQVSNEHLLAKTERASSLVFTSVLALRYAFARARVDSLTLHLAEADPLVNLTFDSTPLLVHELALYVGGGFMF